MAEPAPAPDRIHGTLVEVAGVGVLLLGRSGIGKSECAMELVLRGHRLVADDVIIVTCDGADGPIGHSPEMIRHFVELRGIGIVHVPSLFGASAVAERARVDLVVRLESWGSGEVERVGLERQTQKLGDFELDCVVLPVAPGRNVATLVEVAARNFTLGRQGRSAPRALDDRVNRTLSRRGS